MTSFANSAHGAGFAALAETPLEIGALTGWLAVLTATV
jgi:hypothetical protein